jgi:hypothetical protein
MVNIPTDNAETTEIIETENTAEPEVAVQTQNSADAQADANPEQTDQSTQEPADDMQPQDTQDSVLATHSSSGGARAGGGHRLSTTTAQQPGSPHDPLEVASIASAEFWEEIASMRAQMAADETSAANDPQRIIVKTAQTVSVFLFAGATNWYLKGSSLLASLFSSLPLWTPFDPLPILALNRRMRRRRERTQAAAAALEQRYSTGMTRLLDARAAGA